jgi:hypothetical protein
MRKYSFIVICILITSSLHSQQSNVYQKGITAEKNLKAIAGLAPYSDGAIGFDTRYEGVKGSSRLFDTLLPSFLKVKGEDYYMSIETDFDLIHNSLLFKHPKSGQLLAVPAEKVVEVVIEKDGKELIFRTTEGKSFENGVTGLKFYQVLKEEPYQFIKMPVKIYVEADYKGAYSSDRRYDEYQTKYRYYIMNSGTLQQIQLNKKSLLKLFPDKKEIINNVIKSKSYTNDEEMVLSVLGQF